MRRVHLLKANLVFGFDVDPAAIGKTTAWKGDKVRRFAVDNREFKIAVERCSIYQLPVHDVR